MEGSKCNSFMIYFADVHEWKYFSGVSKAKQTLTCLLENKQVVSKERKFEGKNPEIKHFLTEDYKVQS